ncbi:MAG: hypothetical protein HKP41_04980 [Desulfobacterales bacterium]|nr:hypothetical protein [Deltaproteobacteria bacterium]NNK93688.1 hypothetical protein [Desulfobacterales bacterium]
MYPRLTIHRDKTLELSCQHRYTLRFYRKAPTSIDLLFTKPEPNTLFLADTIETLGEVHAVVVLTTITMNIIVFEVAMINSKEITDTSSLRESRFMQCWCFLLFNSQCRSSQTTRKLLPRDLVQTTAWHNRKNQ